MPFDDAGLGIDFNPEALEGLISNRGTTVVHEIGLTCPCGSDPLNPTTDDVLCEYCFGNGIQWVDAQTIVGLITNITFQPNIGRAAFFQAGDLIFAPSLHAREIGDYDRITLTRPVAMDNGQIITRFGARRVANLKPNEDLILFSAAKSQAIAVIDRTGCVYHPGDYVLEGRRIVWPDEARAPKVGERYTIKYHSYLEYIAFASPMARFDRDRSIGQRVALRLRSVSNILEASEAEAAGIRAVQSDNTDRGIQTDQEKGGIF